MADKTNKIAFQGEPGANSDTACRNVHPSMEPLPCPTFEDAFNAVESGKADLAMIPIENTIAGRVADIHYLLPESKLHIVGEYFLPIHFQLMVLPGVKREEIRSVHCQSRPRPVPQIHPQSGWKTTVAGERRGGQAGGREAGPFLAALERNWGLALPSRIIERNVEDFREQLHPLRVLSKARSGRARRSGVKMMTTFVFRVAQRRPRFTRAWAASPPTE